MEDVAVVLLRAQEISKKLAVMPRLQKMQAEIAVQQVPRPLEWNVIVVPFPLERSGKVLVSQKMLLKRHAAGICDASPDSDVAAITNFDLQEKDEIREPVEMLEQEEPGVALREKAEVQKAPDGALAEIVGVSVTVFR
ncbi:hypothetical protein [Rhizobium leguminosarum]|uniref:hypothetical protein n=1 Tax=Rhizobium leguminosarum TaxID=384 RepID=UPI0021BC2849|nr:hypothetical protein [Rhizobium leguminosarum]